MVAPDQKANKRDGQRRSGDEGIAEDVFTREAGDDFADHPHGRQNHDVDGRMGIKPEEMLEENRIAAEGGIEDPQVENAFGGDQRQDDGDDRSSQKKDDAGGVEGPDE